MYIPLLIYVLFCAYYTPYTWKIDTFILLLSLGLISLFSPPPSSLSLSISIYLYLSLSFPFFISFSPPGYRSKYIYITANPTLDISLIPSSILTDLTEHISEPQKPPYLFQILNRQNYLPCPWSSHSGYL